MYPVLLVMNTNSVLQLADKWKRKPFSSLMLFGVILKCEELGTFNTECILYILGGNGSGVSDLFSILLCSALSLLKVNAVHHCSHKAFQEASRAECAHDYCPFSWVERP